MMQNLTLFFWVSDRKIRSQQECSLLEGKQKISHFKEEEVDHLVQLQIVQRSKNNSKRAGYRN